ncbi:MAG TPA: metallophosphoesterase family protein [Chthoniobacterales bacterium]
MRIAVIADTHGRLRPELLREISGADEIWHLGDVCSEAVLSEIERLGPPVWVVRGNNDFVPRWPLQRKLERGGRTFRLVHIPPPHPGGADFLLHGHTHVPRDEQVGATRVLNPGSAGLANKGAPLSFAWLAVDPATGGVGWRIQPL